MSINEPITSVNVKEQIRLRNEEVKRKEEAQFRLVAKTIQKNDSTGPSLSNLYSTLNSSYSVGGHYSSLKTKKEEHYIPSLNGQKKHNSLYSLSSDNISSNINSNPNVLVLNCRETGSKANLNEGTEFTLVLNEPINESEVDKSKMLHLADYFKAEYNDALKDALRTINMERKFEQRRRKNQDERWESLIKEGRGPSTTELELQRKDREKIDIMSKNREAEVTSCVNKNFENKINFENEVSENIENLLKRWKGKLWCELIEFLEKGSNEDSSSEEESNDESSNNEESESEKEESDEHEEGEKSNEISDDNIEKNNTNLEINASSNQKLNETSTPQTGSLDILNDNEEGRKSELKIEQKLKKSLQSLKPDIEEDSDIQNKCKSLNSVVNENQEKSDQQVSNEDISKAVNDVEESIQCMLKCNEELKNELMHNIESSKPELNCTENIKSGNDNDEKIEVIDISKSNEKTGDNTQISKSQEEIYDPKEPFSSRGSLTQINTSILSSSQQRQSLTNSDSKSYIDIEGNNEAFNPDDTSDDKLKSAPPVLEDDKADKLISPNTASNLKSVNPLHRSKNNLKTDIPYILKHQDKKSLTYDYIKCKPRLSSECRSQVASEVIQMLDDNKLMRASESTPLVAEPGVSILKRIMKKLKKNKPNDNNFSENDMDYQTLSLFGSHLDLLYDRYKDIPPFLKACKKYIKAKGLKKQGIFRISGRSGDIKDLKHKFQVELDYIDIGRQVEIASKIKDEKQRKDRIDYIKNEKKRLQQENPGIFVNLFELCPSESSVASVFKLFFRELIEPLFTFRMYKLWILLDDIQDKAFKLKLASHLILLLPYTHRLMLHYLLHFLSIVASYSSFNDMNSSNLAKVFGPSILRLEEKKKDKPSVELHEKANNVIEFLIDNNEEIFEEGSELIISIETMIKKLYDEEEQNNINKIGNGRSKSHFSISKVSKGQGKSNRNSGVNVDESRKSPLTIEEKKE
ncbi:hypothetical protein BCR32DRAFT_265519 [Anaeromyces robustus]|uniref:Rho-GAP domain-containing protein n=1 Tax=Anaeromyces robustus TaxID=1754192 RepID=A0A1Y1XIT2_9FUNG|nr:hypothetical protein BCR32DRAFT_265519 [Anaeromyces robustus]|eukprot:ORX85675.1 hypothetical protein BCR32DRAFT_265519 [Anaeromyces robustus]